MELNNRISSLIKANPAKAGGAKPWVYRLAVSIRQATIARLPKAKMQNHVSTACTVGLFFLIADGVNRDLVGLDLPPVAVVMFIKGLQVLQRRGCRSGSGL